MATPFFSFEKPYWVWFLINESVVTLPLIGIRSKLSNKIEKGVGGLSLPTPFR